MNIIQDECEIIAVVSYVKRPDVKKTITMLIELSLRTGVHLDTTRTGVQWDKIRTGVHLDTTRTGVHWDKTKTGVHFTLTITLVAKVSNQCKHMTSSIVCHVLTNLIGYVVHQNVQHHGAFLQYMLLTFVIYTWHNTITTLNPRYHTLTQTLAWSERTYTTLHRHIW